MKKLLYLGIVLMFASCGANESESSANELEISSSTANVGGREVSTIQIGNLEVMTQDSGKMRWDDAMKACADLGDGWRLPKKDELNLLYENKEKIGGFANFYYWSSKECDNYDAWVQNFDDGNQFSSDKLFISCARAIRSID